MDIGIGTDIDIGVDEGIGTGVGRECVGVGIGTGIDIGVVWTGVDCALSVINCWKRISNTIAACRLSSLFNPTCAISKRYLFAHHKPIENPDHLSVAPLNRSDHVVASQTPLEVFEFCPPPTLR